MSETPTPETPVITDEMKAAAAKNEWGKTFKLGDREFEIKDLGYFDYLEFVALAKPLVTAVMGGLDFKTTDGVMDLEFNPAGLDMDDVIALAGKELPKMAWLVCKQTDPSIKKEEVAELARRPQRLVEVILLQIIHNKMIEEFGSFFQRLTGLVTAVMPDVAKASAPSSVTPA